MMWVGKRGVRFGLPVIRQEPCDGAEKPCHKLTSWYQSEVGESLRVDSAIDDLSESDRDHGCAPVKYAFICGYFPPLHLMCLGVDSHKELCRFPSAQNVRPALVPSIRVGTLRVRG